MTCGIYQIVNVIDNKIYIGSSKNITRRWIQHRHLLRRNKHSNPYLQNAWNKHKEICFVVEILEQCSIGDLVIIEQYYLDWLEPFEDRGYNLARDANAPSRNPSEESRARMSAAQSGKNNPMFGKHFTEEHKKKISSANKGRSCNEVTKAKIRASKQNISQETRLKLSLAKQGNQARKGQHNSEEHRRKISRALMGNKNGQHKTKIQLPEDSDPRCTNSDGNIAVLCPNCHVKTHAGEIYFIGVYLTSDGMMPIWFEKDQEPSIAREYWIIKDNPLVKTLKGDVED